MQTEYSHNGLKDTSVFFGIEDSAETSLLEYGMVMRNTRGDEYEVYFKVAEGLYGWGVIYKSEIERIITNNSWVPVDKVNLILSKSEQTKESFLLMPIELQIFTIRMVLGHTNTFGKTIDVHTFDEVMRAINSDKEEDEVVEEEIELQAE